MGAKVKNPVRCTAVALVLLCIAWCSCSDDRTAGMCREAEQAYMRMNYRGAWDTYMELLERSSNHLDWLEAYMGLMDICQRTSDNISFYEYRNKALQESRNLEKGTGILTRDEQVRLKRIQTMIRFVSARYFMELEQPEMAYDEYVKTQVDDLMRSDTLLNIHRLCMYGEGFAGPDVTLQERIRSLERALRMARDSGDSYAEAKAMQIIASILVSANDRVHFNFWEFIDEINESGVSAELLPQQLALKALQIFLHWDYVYEAIETYCLLASYHIGEADYQSAYNCLLKVLELVNGNMSDCYPEARNIPLLDVYRDDGLVVENVWKEQVPLALVPECMCRVREQLGLVLSGLGDKAASDYNRNVYLELQKTIRLDRRYEARTALLSKVNNRLNMTLVGVLSLVALLVLVIVLARRYMIKRTEQYNDAIEHFMQLLVGILSVDFSESDARTEEHLREMVQRELERLDMGSGKNRYMTELVAGITPYLTDALQKASALDSMADQRRYLDELWELQRNRTEQGVRQGLSRKACYATISDCMPLIERMVAEIDKLAELTEDGPVRAERLAFIRDLSERINNYNEVLSDWIKTNKGIVPLHIETFELGSLFGIVGGCKGGFERMGLVLQVDETDLLVKADRALTLFMINTLTENAGKYTPSGGSVHVWAEPSDGYVEISVADTGVGISEQDVEKILSTKVYDSSQIGSDNTLVASKKGGGFGILNCKGIIDKYRMSGEFFKECAFGIESETGKGSRFWFRLPKGVGRKVLSLLACALIALTSMGIPAAAPGAQIYDDSLLVEAYIMADAAYISNTELRHEDALHYACRAFELLNEDRIRVGADTLPEICMSGDVMDESGMAWLESGFPTDYETILWLRNEVAVAALALGDWPLYHYNNDAYLSLFKKYYAESQIEEDSLNLQRTNSNLQIAIILCVILLLLVIMVSGWAYSKHWVRYKSDLMQVFDVLKVISADLSMEGSLDIHQVLDNLVIDLHYEIGMLVPLRSLCLMVVEPDGNRYIKMVGDSASAQLLEELTAAGNDCRYNDVCVERLLVESDSASKKVGALGIEFSAELTETRQSVLNMIVRYLTVALYSNVWKMVSEKMEVEQMEEESQRAEYEISRMHVDNLIMDNSLSMLKHETVWFPNRIMQIAQKALDSAGSAQVADGVGSVAADEGVRQYVGDLQEVAHYYKELFGVLSRNVRWQQTGAVFRRQAVRVSAILDYASCFASASLPSSISVEIRESDCDGMSCSTDGFLVQCLVENILRQFASDDREGEVCVSAVAADGFVRFVFEDDRLCLLENLEQMFTPLWKPGNLDNVICRQIIREHDEASGHCGCRINACLSESGCLQIWFAIPALV